MPELEPEVLVSVSIRLPQSDRSAMAQHLAPVITAAIAAGGITTNVSLQPYDPDGDD